MIPALPQIKQIRKRDIHHTPKIRAICALLHDPRYLKYNPDMNVVKKYLWGAVLVICFTIIFISCGNFFKATIEVKNNKTVDITVDIYQNYRYIGVGMFTYEEKTYAAVIIKAGKTKSFEVSSGPRYGVVYKWINYKGEISQSVEETGKVDTGDAIVIKIE